MLVASSVPLYRRRRRVVGDGGDDSIVYSYCGGKNGL